MTERSEAARHGDAEASRAEREERDKDDPERLAEEARAQVERMSADLRKAKVPIETEPPTAYRP